MRPMSPFRERLKSMSVLAPDIHRSLLSWPGGLLETTWCRWSTRAGTHFIRMWLATFHWPIATNIFLKPVAMTKLCWCLLIFAVRYMIMQATYHVISVPQIRNLAHNKPCHSIPMEQRVDLSSMPRKSKYKRDLYLSPNQNRLNLLKVECTWRKD